LIAEYIRSLAKWTKGLVFVGMITIAVLIAHAVIFYKTDATTHESLGAVRRAFVFLKRVDLMSYTNSTTKKVETWLLEPHWENSGDTPTKNLHLRIVCGFMVGDENTQFDWNAHEAQFPQSKIGDVRRVLGPHQIDSGGTCSWPAGIISELLLLAMPNSTCLELPPTRMYLTGQRTTRFCFQGYIAGTAYDASPGILIGRDLCAGNNNCADEECDREPEVKSRDPVAIGIPP
jgi:hypothetical protein